MSRKIYVLDASVVLAMTKDDPAEVEVKAATIEIFNMVEAGQVGIAVSTILATELLDEAWDRIEVGLDGRKGNAYEPSLQTARLARDIRQWSRKKGRFKALDTPDCLYVALASEIRATALLTCEGMGGKPNSLLGLSGEIQERYGVRVQLPQHALNAGTLFEHVDE